MFRNLEKQLTDYLVADQARFYRLAYSYLKDREEALDAVQTAVCRAWEQQDHLRDPDAVRVTRWDASERGCKSVPDGEAVAFSDGFSFRAEPDSVYEVIAQWDGEDTGGRLSWGFRTVE